MLGELPNEKQSYFIEYLKPIISSTMKKVLHEMTNNDEGDGNYLNDASNRTFITMTYNVT